MHTLATSRGLHLLAGEIALFLSLRLLIRVWPALCLRLPDCAADGHQLLCLHFALKPLSWQSQADEPLGWCWDLLSSSALRQLSSMSLRPAGYHKWASDEGRQGFLLKMRVLFYCSCFARLTTGQRELVGNQTCLYLPLKCMECLNECGASA